MFYPGGFTPYRDVDCRDLAVFYEATRELRGTTYKPYLVATQEARGVNFRFICNSTIMTRPPQNAITMVCIFKPFCKEHDKARAVVTSICKMGCYNCY
ncbi:hypothetical protein RZO55_12545 [Clostridium boliviensis]|uniref:Uncharacterized protein n=1 Tax=Clostridium boliviensis TaxID=318465 RepID=A0ABU4GN79_9CLOT|nr:hypothetical protein [Clostridium boliviensis]MDW2798403.1 hypothetical protein [Clostridium boliviensis]